MHASEAYRLIETEAGLTVSLLGEFNSPSSPRSLLLEERLEAVVADLDPVFVFVDVHGVPRISPVLRDLLQRYQRRLSGQGRALVIVSQEGLAGAESVWN